MKLWVLRQRQAGVKMKIFIIEDEPLIRKELKILLENALYEVYSTENYDNAEEDICIAKPDIVLLDVNLPEISGFDLCVKIREKTEVPIIFLTSRTDAMDELTGMLKGGDDYITKPYQAPILLARIAAVLKRTKGCAPQAPEELSCRGVILRPAACSLEYQGQKMELTKNELKILHCLYQQEGRFVPRMDLIEYLWENQVFIDDNTLSVNVTRLREKLRQLGIDDFIVTKRGMGYRV